MLQVKQTQPKVMITLKVFVHLAQTVKSATQLDQFIFADIQSVVSPGVFIKLMEQWGGIEAQPEDGVVAHAIGESMDLLMQDAPTELPPPTAVSGADLAAILFTSGTTGAPKGVCLTHRNLVANTLQARHWIPDLLYGKEVCLAALPILHSYGLINAMSLPIALAGTTVLLPVFDTIVDLISGEDLPPDEIGELVVRGPQVMQKYRQDEQATAEAIDAVPWKIEFRETLPKSFIGKVLRRMLVLDSEN